MAFANAANSGDAEDFLASLSPDVSFLSKWKNLSGEEETADYLNRYFLHDETSGEKRRVFVGVLIADDRRIPCAYALETIDRPWFTLMFRLDDDGKVSNISSYPSHYLGHRDGKLFDVLG